MPFHPKVGQELAIDNAAHRIAEHPAAPGMPYGQEGRQAVVYQLVAQDGDAQALKVFKPRYRSPALVSLADRIAPFARLTGLRVCRRTVLAPQRHAPLLRQHPDLTYAVLMPWVGGPTWMEVLLEERALSPEESLALARSLAGILVGMEQNGLAHCDLSGPNVLLPALVQPVISDRRPPVELVDVEQLYGSDLRRPELLPGGSPGYAHKTAPQGLWGSTADRFAGAVLLGEILGWCDGRVREAAWGENYFDPQEMQRDSERFQVLIAVLGERWGKNVAGVFERAWRSDVLADCATFGEWLVTLPEEVPVVEAVEVAASVRETKGAQEEAIENTLQVLMGLARQFEEQGNLESALQTYRQAQKLAPAESGLAEELALIVQGVEARQAEAAGPEPHMLVEEADEEPVVPVPRSALERELALIEEVEETPDTEPEQPVEEVETELPVTEPQPAEEMTEEPAAPVPQSALASELVLVEQGVETGVEESSTPELRLPVEEKLKAEVAVPDNGPMEEETEAAEVIPFPPAGEETDLDRLFDEGLAAYHREEWARAQELLGEVVRRQRDYARDGQKARDLLAEAEKHLAQPRYHVPSWIWVLGVLVVLAAVGCVVAEVRNVLWTMPSGSEPQAVVATKIVEVTVTPQPTSTPGPTHTPTRTPEPTYTPTRTPGPSPLATATIDATPGVYDNFDDPSNDGSFDKSQWILWTNSPNQVVQQDGVLMVRADIETETSGQAKLGARQYEGVTLSTLTANAPTFIEAKLMLSSDEHAGNVQLGLSAYLEESCFWFSECNIMDYGDDSVWASCFDTRWPWQEGYQYSAEEESVNLGTWHKFRMEVDPSSMTFTYYIDDQMVGSHVPSDADKLREAQFTVTTGVWGGSSGEVTGYIDDVRIGQITPTPAATFYDDFDDATYDATINPTKWEFDLPEVCDVAQQEGMMVFKNTPPQSDVDCVLGHPNRVSIGDLSAMEARINISSDHNGKYLNQGINFNTGDLPGGAWWAFCGLEADADSVRSLFDIRNWGARDESDIWEISAADYDQWYTFRLEVDSDTMTISCFVDDKLLGSIVPRDASELRSARFYRNLDVYRTPGSFATTYVDDVRIGEVGQ